MFSFFFFFGYFLLLLPGPHLLLFGAGKRVLDTGEIWWASAPLTAN